LTGGLAAGKSTVARMLARRGCRVIDADRLVADLYRPGEPGARVVAELFGTAALNPEGAVDHDRVARRVFADPAARRRLEQAIHPLVRERFRTLAETAAEDVVVLEAALLAEAGFAPDFDRVITVEAPLELRLARAVARGMTPEDARRRLLAQGEGDARRRAAHRVIDNDGSLEHLEAQVDAVLQELREG
jgi:dephospho-CoA kinase